MVGHEDNLFGIEDGRVMGLGIAEDEWEKSYSKLREKRWAIYLARAVHRYEVWWKNLGGRPLTEHDMEGFHTEYYDHFPLLNLPKQWEVVELMPLGI